MKFLQFMQGAVIEFYRISLGPDDCSKSKMLHQRSPTSFSVELNYWLGLERVSHVF